MPESVRWLLSNGRIEEAKKVIELAAKTNRKQIPHHLLKEADLSEIELNKDEKAGVSKKKITVLELFKTRIILLKQYVWLALDNNSRLDHGQINIDATSLFPCTFY